MQAIRIAADGGLYWTKVADPVLKPGCVVIKVRAAGVNRADLLQAAGKYPPPPGWPDWPGLECSGVIEAARRGAVGTRAMKSARFWAAAATPKRRSSPRGW